MSINTIIFGLCGLDTVDIGKELKQDIDFNIIKWFGTLPGSDVNTYDFYNFQNDYDNTILLPEDYTEYLQNSLADFLISNSRRNESKIPGNTITLGFNSIYSSLHDFKRYSYYFYKLFIDNQIDLVIIDSVPHTSADLILDQTARFFNKKILYLYQPNFKNRFMYFSKEEVIDRKVDFSVYYDDKTRIIKSQSEPYKIIHPETPFYSQRDFSHLHYDVNKLLRDMKNMENTNYFCFGTSNFIKSIVTDENKFIYLQAMLKSGSFNSYNKNLKLLETEKFNLNDKFIYFPLSFQPELTTECLGGEFMDIVSAIEKIRNLIPEEWYIYVKEHPAQYEFARDANFFSRIKFLKNVIFVPRNYSSFQLIKNSQFVASVNGTVGYEAIQMGKNALNFGSIYYQGLPGVFLYNDQIKLQDILNYEIDLSELENQISILISRMEEGVVNAGYSTEIENFNSENNAKLIRKFIKNFFYGTV